MLILSIHSNKYCKRILVVIITVLGAINICMLSRIPESEKAEEPSKIISTKVSEIETSMISISDKYKDDIATDPVAEIVTATPTSTATPSPIKDPTPSPTDDAVAPAITPSAVLAAPNPVAQFTPKSNIATASDATPVTKYGVFDRVNYIPSEQEMMMFCAVVSSETGYCTDKVQKAVAHTIINRIISPKFPNNLYAALTQRNQYTAVTCYFTGIYRPGLHPGSASWNHTMSLIYEALNEVDFTNGAFAYYNPHMMGYNAWFESLIFTYEDQYGRFFKF